MKQKEIFMNSEGDAWFARNKETVASRKLPESDPLLCEILEIYPSLENMSVLEIGCGDGSRLAWLKKSINADCYGIEPSANAVTAACAKGLNVCQGTADELPFDNQTFDIVIFGFCLYVCDREDLFVIASEADRVLRAPGCLMIMDFFSPVSQTKIYDHLPGVDSHKMDYRTLFTWHPDYECITHKVRHHIDARYTDNQDEWTAVSVLRKYRKDLSA